MLLLLGALLLLPAVQANCCALETLDPVPAHAHTV